MVRYMHLQVTNGGSAGAHPGAVWMGGTGVYCREPPPMGLCGYGGWRTEEWRAPGLGWWTFLLFTVSLSVNNKNNFTTEILNNKNYLYKESTKTTVPRTCFCILQLFYPFLCFCSLDIPLIDTISFEALDLFPQRNIKYYGSAWVTVFI